MVNAYKRRRVLTIGTLGVAAAGLILVLARVPALASDGVIEINQAKVMARGGFPFQINQSGSYRLTSDLVVPNADTTAISVNVPHVTIDLNGFSIIGPGTLGSGIGIYARAADHAITIYNGEVAGMGSNGISVPPGSRVERVRALANGGVGISCNDCLSSNCDHDGCDISHNIANNNQTGIFIEDYGGLVSSNVTQFNSGFGIVIGTTSVVVSENTANHNGSAGIWSSFGPIMLRHNTVSDNNIGLDCEQAVAGYAENVFSSNPGGNFGSGIGGSCVNLGHNLCDTSVCP